MLWNVVYYTPPVMYNKLFDRILFICEYIVYGRCRTRQFITGLICFSLVILFNVKFNKPVFHSFKNKDIKSACVIPKFDIHHSSISDCLVGSGYYYHTLHLSKGKCNTNRKNFVGTSRHNMYNCAMAPRVMKFFLSHIQLSYIPWLHNLNTKEAIREDICVWKSSPPQLPSLIFMTESYISQFAITGSRDSAENCWK
jgi:hypothetical protein